MRKNNEFLSVLTNDNSKKATTFGDEMHNDEAQPATGTADYGSTLTARQIETADSNAAESGNRRRAGETSFLRYLSTEPAMFLFMCSQMIKFPVFQQLLYEKACWQKYASNVSFCDDVRAVHADIELQHEANRLLLLSTLCLLLPSLLVSMVLGSMFDLWNARRTLLIPFVGLLLADLNYILQCAYLGWNPYWLLASDVLFGFTGSFTSVIGLFFAYSVKSTPAEYRSERVAVMEGSIGFGSMVGLLLSGHLRQQVGFTRVFAVVTALHLMTIGYLLVKVFDFSSHSSSFSDRSQTSHQPSPSASTASQQESREVEKTPLRQRRESAGSQERRPPIEKGLCLRAKIHLVRHLTDVRNTIFARNNVQNSRMLHLLLLAFGIEMICFAGLLDIMFSFLRYQLAWTDKEYGWFGGVSSALGSVSVILLYPILHHRLGVSDGRLAMMGLFGKIVNLIMLAFSKSSWLAMLATLPLIVQRFASSGMRSMASRMVRADEQGKVFQVIALLEAVSFLLASLLFNGLYPITLPFFPGTMLLASAFLLLVPSAMLLLIDRHISSSLPDSGGVAEHEASSSPSASTNQRAEISNS